MDNAEKARNFIWINSHSIDQTYEIVHQILPYYLNLTAKCVENAKN